MLRKEQDSLIILQLSDGRILLQQCFSLRALIACNADIFVELQFPFWEDSVDVWLLEEQENTLKEFRIKQLCLTVFLPIILLALAWMMKHWFVCVQVCVYLCDSSRALGVDEQQ